MTIVTPRAPPGRRAPHSPAPAVAGDTLELGRDLYCGAGARDGFDVTLPFEPGLYPRGAPLASSGDTVVEIPLGR